jgi:hypothetical protein
MAARMFCASHGCVLVTTLNVLMSGRPSVSTMTSTLIDDPLTSSCRLTESGMFAKAGGRCETGRGTLSTSRSGSAVARFRASTQSPYATALASVMGRAFTTVSSWSPLLLHAVTAHTRAIVEMCFKSDSGRGTQIVHDAFLAERPAGVADLASVRDQQMRQHGPLVARKEGHQILLDLHRIALTTQG